MRLKFILPGLFLVIILGGLGAFLFISDNVYLFSSSIYVPKSLPVSQKEATRIANSAISVYLPEKRFLLCRSISEETAYYSVAYGPFWCCFQKCMGGWAVIVNKSTGGWTSAGLLK